MALNQAGLPLLGARSPEQVVGRCLGALVPPEAEASLSSFLAGICAGGRGTIEIDCSGVDGVRRRLELRAVPLRRDPEKIVTVLAALREVTAASAARDYGGREVERALRSDLAATTEALKAAEARLNLREEEWQKEKASAEKALRDLEMRLRLAGAPTAEVEQGAARKQ
jgi:hypothetical protein